MDEIREIALLILSVCVLFFCLHLYFQQFEWKGMLFLALVIILACLFYFAREIDD